MIRRISPLARLTDPETSHQAAADAAAHSATDREMALIAHYRHRELGLTDFELAELIYRQPTSAGGRRCDLMKPSRKHVPEPWVEAHVTVSGAKVKRPTPSGSAAQVWRINEAGMKAAERLLERLAAA